MVGLVTGLTAAGLILFLIAAAMAGLAGVGGVSAAAFTDRYTFAVVGFTFWQALLSTLISVLAAIPLARALARRRFVGRRWLLALTGVAFIMPVMVAALGIISVYGLNGWLGWIFGDGNLYGLGGILIAHAFFNIPLATRIFLGGINSISQNNWNLAAMYGLRPVYIFWRLEWAVIRGLLPGAAALIFLLCFTSFAAVLVLGGGPAATTLEIAIYQAIRFDFDLPKAVALAAVQIFLCAALTLILFSAARSFPLSASAGEWRWRCDSDLLRTKFVDAMVLMVAALFFALPILAVVGKVLAPGGWTIIATPGFWRALGWTILIAAAAGLISVVVALALCDAVVSLKSRGGKLTLELIGALTLIIPPITLGAGLFLLMRRISGALSLAPLAVIALNALFTLAFALRILLPRVQSVRAKTNLLCTSLGILGLNRWRILWRQIRPTAFFALAVACALAAGDLGVIALFGSGDLHTLPLLIHRLLGAYRLDAAAVVAAINVAVCFGFFILFDKWGRDERALRY